MNDPRRPTSNIEEELEEIRRYEDFSTTGKKIPHFKGCLD